MNTTEIMNQDRYHRAARDGFRKILYDVSKRDANQSDDDGLTPTLLAAYCGHLDALRVLVGRGGDPEKTTLCGSSALHLAASKGYLNCVSFLVNFGVNLWSLDNDLRTAKDIAAMNKRKEILDYLDDTMAKQSALNTKTVQRLKEKAIVAAEKRIKLFRKHQMKTIKQAEKENRNMRLHKRRLFSANSTSDINLVGTCSLSKNNNTYKFSDQFGDNLYLKSAKNLYNEDERLSKDFTCRRLHSVTSLASRDSSSNSMKFSDIVNNKTSSDYQQNNQLSLGCESTITSKIRSIGGVSRKVHLKKLMQTISNSSSESPNNQQQSTCTSMPDECNIKQCDDLGNCSMRSLNGIRRDDQILYVPKYDTRSLNVSMKRQPVATVFRSNLSPESGTPSSSASTTNTIGTENCIKQTLSQLQSISPASTTDDVGPRKEQNIRARVCQHHPDNRLERNISRAISVPDFTSEAFVEDTIKYREFLMGQHGNEDANDDENDDENEMSRQRETSQGLEGRLAPPKFHISQQIHQIDSANNFCSEKNKKLNTTHNIVVNTNNNFGTLDDSIGSAGSLAQRNTSSISTTKSSSTSMSSNSNMFESISIKTDESRSNFNPTQDDSTVVDKGNLLLRKMGYLDMDRLTPHAGEHKPAENAPVLYSDDAIDMFLITNGLIDLRETFHKERIDLEALMLLTDDDLKSLNILLGPRRKLLKALQNRSTQMHNPQIMMDTPL